VSTDEVYGSLGPDDPAFSETTPYAPNSPYSASKAASDHLVRAYHHTYGLSVTTSNCSNNYGPYHFPEKLIPLVIVNMLEGKKIPVYGDGLNVRDWLHVSDHCAAIDAILERGKPGEVYNVGGGAESTNIDLIKTLCAIADEIFARDPKLRERFPNSPAARGESAASLITYVRDRPGHDRRYAIDCSKLERELGYTARTRVTDGLRSTFDWYLANEPWWRAIMDGSYQRWIETQYAKAN
jgi:dTDP-glucose 4,6-dehydratase